MSVQAMTWALAQTLVQDPTCRHVLLCLANYADKQGRNAFPAVSTLSADTGLSERTVRYKLAALKESGVITLGNQRVALAYFSQPDRTPVCYDLNMSRGAPDAPRSASQEAPEEVLETGAGAGDPSLQSPQEGVLEAADRGAPDAPRAQNPEKPTTGCTSCTPQEGTGCSSQQDGVQMTTERGAPAAPKPSFNRPLTEEQHACMREGVEADGWGRHRMTADWLPDAKSLEDQLYVAGLAGKQIPEEVLAGFKGHFLTLPTVENPAKWCQRLVRWFAKERALAASTPSMGDWADEDLQV
ncbi:helix-turn-helix domain-containing protein [Pseudomonas sp. PDM13]|uniref:helix-turn-helix domain-containing protein n=1 Tax=Pseudomonas sp. PDM13 TaxID=2769255 RepID=UPI0021E0EEF6|nr:helix-turn-helix domain-containing protein [Pseudomonas sp. PDM13]MCU9947524.1 DnaT-like ssDNA-binding domain-containing protein [Pseudomonas sp. PDM13]